MKFKNVLNKMGLVEDDIPVKTNGAKMPVSSQPVSTAQPVFTPSYAPTPSIDPAISDMLKQSLESNKLSGFDYMKFTSAVEEMKSTGSSEDARYKMAFFAARQLGVDKANLLKSGEHYLDVLKQDENDFNSDCSEYDKKEVKSRESKLAQIESNLENLGTQLTQLHAERVKVSEELQNEKARLDSRKSSFQATLQNFRSTIETNIQKINQYLQ